MGVLLVGRPRLRKLSKSVYSIQRAIGCNEDGNNRCVVAHELRQHVTHGNAVLFQRHQFIALACVDQDGTFGRDIPRAPEAPPPSQGSSRA
jgi:hypothetical protein